MPRASNLRDNLGSPLSTRTGLWFAVGPIKPSGTPGRNGVREGAG